MSDRTMTDAAGQQIPLAYVKPIDRARDRMVRRLHTRAAKLNRELAAFKRECLAEVAAFQKQAAATYGVVLGGEKNGIILTSFDGRLRVERRNCETLAFDERLAAAQALIKEWIAEKTAHTDGDIITLVNRAFMNSRNSGLRFSSVIQLTRLNIKGEKWHRAMELIKDSIQVQSSKTHCRFYERASAEEEFVLIPLDIAKVGEKEVQP